jgi:hypothetical protein
MKRSLLWAEGLRGSFKEKVTLKQVLKDRKVLQVQGARGGSEALQVEEAGEEKVANPSSKL